MTQLAGGPRATLHGSPIVTLPLWHQVAIFDGQPGDEREIRRVAHKEQALLNIVRLRYGVASATVVVGDQRLYVPGQVSAAGVNSPRRISKRPVHPSDAATVCGARRRFSLRM